MNTKRLIGLLGEIRCEYNCFDENEREKYEALSEAIRKLKPREYIKLVPCVCGGRRREMWWHVKDGWFYKCINCGRSSPPSHREEEARKNWNEYISKLKGGDAE